MVVRWACHNPLNIDDRRAIKDGLDAGLTYRAIAKSINRGKTTIQREVLRFKSLDDYDPEKAQAQFERMYHEKMAKMIATHRLKAKMMREVKESLLQNSKQIEHPVNRP